MGHGSWVMGQLLGLMSHATRAGLRTQVMDCSRLWKAARSGSIDACMSGSPLTVPTQLQARCGPVAGLCSS